MGQGSGSNIVTTGTKRCPYCGEEINVTATKCRYCGEWLAKNVTKPSEQKVEEIQDKDMTAADVTGFDMEYNLNKLSLSMPFPCAISAMPACA